MVYLHTLGDLLVDPDLPFGQPWCTYILHPYAGHGMNYFNLRLIICVFILAIWHDSALVSIGSSCFAVRCCGFPWLL